MRLYLDTNPFIYAVEGAPAIRAYCLQRLRAIAEHPTGTLLTSRLAYLKCMVQPIRSKDPDRRTRFEAFFADSAIVVADVSNEILSVAAEIRAETRLKLVDSIHVATAIVHGANTLLTRDRDMCELRALRGVVFEPIPAIA
ncbi:MAG: type II toxin-antitoxin system VapC family toxin [Vicinamibacteria bacterium]